MHVFLVAKSGEKILVHRVIVASVVYKQSCLSWSIGVVVYSSRRSSKKMADDDDERMVGDCTQAAKAVHYRQRGHR